MTDQEEYIGIEDAAHDIGVTRASLYYYIKALKMETVGFQFDKKRYLRMADFQRIKDIKNASPSARKATFRTEKENSSAKKDAA
jgi:hypothetical protein